MSLNCFFGLELHPDGIPVTPVIPPRSKLVLTHCAITSPIRTHSTPTSAGSSKNSSHPSHDPAPSSSLDHRSSNGGKASKEGNKKSWNGVESVEEGGEAEFLDGAVTLYVQGEGKPETFALGTLSVLKGITYLPLDLLFTKEIRVSLQKSSCGATGSAAGYPSVHLTGYYEEDVDAFEEDSESEEEADR